MFLEGAPADYMITIFSQLAINTSTAEMYYNSQTNIVNTIDNQRLSVSQVDLNE